MPQYAATKLEINTVSNEEELARTIEKHYNFSDDAHKNKKDKFKEYEREFLSRRDDIADVEVSNTYVPKTYEAIRGIQASIEEMVFSSRPFGRAVARLADKAPLENKVSKIVDYYLDHADFAEVSDLIFQDALVIGSSPYLKVWENETGLVPKMGKRITGLDPLTLQYTFEDYIMRDDSGDIVMEDGEIFDGYRIIPIRIYDWFPPAGADNHFVDKWPYVVRRFWATRLEWEQAGIYKNVDRIHGGGANRGSEEFTSQQRDDLRLTYYVPEQNEYECLEYYTNEKIYAKIKGGDFLIRNDSNPYLRKPVGCAMIYPKKDSPWGMGLVEMTQLLQRTYNVLVDSLIDETNIQRNKPVVISEDVDWNTINQGIRQNQIVRVASGVDVRSAVSFIPENQIIPSAFQLIAMFGNYLQSSLAFTDLAKGLPQQGMDTATEIATQSQNMGIVIKFFTKNLERTFAKNVFRDALRYCQLFLTEEKAYRILGDRGGSDTLTISPSEILGDYDFWFDWSSREINATVQIAHISNFMQSLNQIQVFTPIHGLLVEAELRNFNIWDKEKIQKAVE